MVKQDTNINGNIRVFYYTGALPMQEDRGSSVRIVNMLSALKSLHPDLRVIAGTSGERHRKVQQLKREVRDGATIDFIYAENTNIPIALESKRLSPLALFRHLAFLYWVKRNNIPVGYFYRDIRWRFPFFTKVLHGPLAHALKPLNWLDWWAINKVSNILYLPSERMNRWLPRPRQLGTFAALPPGFDPNRCTPDAPSTTSKVLRLLYVGGLNKPVYSLTRSLKAICNHDYVHLTICCRPNEWATAKQEIEPLLGNNAEIVHAHHDKLSALYSNSDLFLLAMDPCEYWEFSYPVKFAESIGYGVPVVCCNYQQAIAAIINEKDIGWTLNEPEDLVALVESGRLQSEIAAKRENVLAVRGEFSWLARATGVSNQLLHGSRT